MWLCLKNNEAQIGIILALLSAVIAGGGFYAAWWQLSRTEQTLRAANTYQVQKDAREILDKLTADKAFRTAVASGQGLSDPAVSDKIWLMLNFYQAVYRQAIANGLSPEFVRSFKLDFCKFVGLPAIDAFWKKLEADHGLSESQIAMRKEWCT